MHLSAGWWSICNKTTLHRRCKSSYIRYLPVCPTYRLLEYSAAAYIRPRTNPLPRKSNTRKQYISSLNENPRLLDSIVLTKSWPVPTIKTRERHYPLHSPSNAQNCYQYPYQDFFIEMKLVAFLTLGCLSLVLASPLPNNGGGCACSGPHQQDELAFSVPENARPERHNVDDGCSCSGPQAESEPQFAVAENSQPEPVFKRSEWIPGNPSLS